MKALLLTMLWMSLALSYCEERPTGPTQEPWDPSPPTLEPMP